MWIGGVFIIVFLLISALSFIIMEEEVKINVLDQTPSTVDPITQFESQ